MKKKIAILLAALILLLCFAACSTSCSKKRHTDPLIGTWEYDLNHATYLITFQKNGKVTVEFINNLYGTSETFEYAYTAKDGKLTVEERYIEADYTIEGDTLTVSFGNSVFVLTRKNNASLFIPSTPDPAAALIGTWVLERDGEVDIISFRERGVVVSRTIIPDSGIDWTSTSFYSVKDGQLFVDDRGVDYRLSGDKLTLVIDGEDYVLTRNDSAESLLVTTPRPAEETDPAERLIGTWTLDGVEGEGEAAEQARSVLSLVEATYTFREDGTVTVTATAFGQTSEESSTYSLDGDKLTVAGDTGTIEIIGDTLKMHLSEGYTVVYRKK